MKIHILSKYINNVIMEWVEMDSNNDQHARQAFILGYYGWRSPVLLQGLMERLPRLACKEAIMLGWSLSHHPFQAILTFLLFPPFSLFIHSFSDFHT
jgi:hypothetical protein